MILRDTTNNNSFCPCSPGPGSVMLLGEWLIICGTTNKTYSIGRRWCLAALWVHRIVKIQRLHGSMQLFMFVFDTYTDIHCSCWLWPLDKTKLNALLTENWRVVHLSMVCHRLAVVVQPLVLKTSSFVKTSVHQTSLMFVKIIMYVIRAASNTHIRYV